MNTALHFLDYAHLVVCGVLFFLCVTGFSLKIFDWVLLYLCAWGILVCSFLTLSLSGFGIRIMLESQSVLKSILFASVFWKRLCSIVTNVNLSSYVWQNSPVKLSRFREIFWGVLKLHFQFSHWLLSLVKYFVLCELR